MVLTAGDEGVQAQPNRALDWQHGIAASRAVRGWFRRRAFG